MGRKRSKRSRARSTSSSSRARTPSPPRKRNKVSRKDTEAVSTLNNIIPDFDPLEDNINAWLNIIKSYAQTFAWSDETTRFQALNKLKGPAKVWYDSLLRTDVQWPLWQWKDWKSKLLATFQIQRNMFELLKDIVERKPVDNQSLYEFYFEQKCKIDRLCLNFSEQDIVSIIVGNISDYSTLESGNFKTCDELASYLHGRFYKKNIKQINNSRDGQTKTISNQKLISVDRSLQVHSNVSNHPSPSCVSSDSTNNNNNYNQTQNRKIIKCYICGGNHKKMHCEANKCDFCGKRGHIESVCYQKKNLVKSAVKPEQHETKFISSDSKQKFIKKVLIFDTCHEAFIDTGSSCSLIAESLVNKLSLKFTELPSPVILQGFSKQNYKKVTKKVLVDISFDSIALHDVDFYVIDDLVGCDLLIGRNITERSDLVYSRVGDLLQFQYASDLKEICNHVVTSEINANSHLAELITLLNHYNTCIANNIKELGKVTNHEMEIKLSSSQPIQYRPYRTSHSDRQIIREMVSELLENNIIRDSNSPYASPVLLVSKKNGEKRLCIDYRALNKITIKDKYPMPRIEDLVDRLQGYKVFTSLDLKSGYYQIGVHKDSVDKTAFITEDGHYEFLRLPFGLANAPSCFQQMMNKTLGNLRFGNVIVYLDDVYLVSQTVEENIKLLENILKIFKQNGLTLNLKKCNFFKHEIEFLGYKIKSGCVMPNETKLEAVKNFPIPKTVHQLRQFLGLISYFRKFIRNCAILSTPLTKLLKKNSVWEWGEVQTKAFYDLREKLTTESVLAIFDPNKETILYTDASREGLAGILTQVGDEGEKVVHYYSRQTTDDEKKYHSFELELLAIVCSLQKFRLYLLGSHFKIITDCSAVRYAINKKDIIPRIARWVLSTQEFSFDILHRDGSRMQHVDALSRNPVPSGQKSETEIIMSITESDWLLAVQVQDPKLVKIREILESGQAEINKEIFNNYELLGGKVYRRTNYGRRWVVPKSCIWQIIRSNHDDVGHFSLDKTVERIHSLYWFPRMWKIVKKYIKNCLNCIYHKNKGGPKEGELYPLPKYAQPFHTLHLDHLGPFVTTKNKNKYILVVVDAFTKFVFISAVRKTCTVGVIKELENISKTFGNARRIITDAASCFTSSKFTQYCANRNIRLHIVATGVPRANGQVERFNKTILKSLKAMGADTNDDKWDQCIKALQQGLNSTIHKTTRAVPCEVMFGYRLRMDNDSLAPDSHDEVPLDVTQLREKVDSNIKTSAEYQKRKFDNCRVKAKQYTEGDLVLVKIQSQSNDGQSRKLLPSFRGPFQVKKVLGHDRYAVVDLRGSERSSRKYNGTAVAENMKPWINIGNWDLDQENL